MRRILAVLAILAISTLATLAHAQFRASDVCKMKRSQSERDQCLEYGLRGSLMRLKGNTQRLLDSSRVPDSEKQSIRKSHSKWASQFESKCSDNECHYDMSSARNNEIEKVMAKYNIAPM